MTPLVVVGVEPSVQVAVPVVPVVPVVPDWLKEPYATVQTPGFNAASALRPAVPVDGAPLIS